MQMVHVMCKNIVQTWLSNSDPSNFTFIQKKLEVFRDLSLFLLKYIDCEYQLPICNTWKNAKHILPWQMIEPGTSNIRSQHSNTSL